MAELCPIKTHKFYTNLLTHFNEEVDDNDITKDAKSFEIWMKTSDPTVNAPFLEWYGKGKVDSFDNPILVENLYYQNEAGQRLIIDELLNTVDFTNAERLQELHDEVDAKVQALKKSSDKYFNEYDKLIREVQDVVTKFGTIYGRHNEVYSTKIKDLQNH